MVVKANYVLCFLRKIVASSLSDFPSGLVPVRLHLQYCVQFGANELLEIHTQ